MLRRVRFPARRRKRGGGSGAAVGWVTYAALVADIRFGYAPAARPSGRNPTPGSTRSAEHGIPRDKILSKVSSNDLGVSKRLPSTQLTSDQGDAKGTGGCILHQGDRLFGRVVEPVSVQ